MTRQPGPLVLGIETTGELCSVAVSSGDALLSEHAFSHRMTLSVRLMSVLDAVLQGAGVELTRLDALACDVGPGSFTGVRIGVAAVAALSISTGLPVYGETSLRTVAARLIGTDVAEVIAVMPHNRSAISAQKFRYGKEVVSPPEAVGFTELAQYVGPASGSVLLCGPGARSASAHLNGAVRVAAEDYPRAGEIARQAARRIHAGEAGLDAEELLPLYIEPPAISTPKSVSGLPRR